MKAQFSAVALALSVTLVACGKSASNGPSAAAPEAPVGQLNQAQESATQAKVSCADRGRCPENVALLASAMSESSVDSCTAFLVAPNLMITSAACVPQDLQAAGSVCVNRIWAHFAQTASNAAESAGCDQVVSIDAKVALLKLSRSVSRQPLEISREGLTNHETLTVAKVNPVRTSPPEGELQVIPCKVAQNSLIAADLLDECVAVRGNGGAPVLDSNGKARALIERAVAESDRIALSQTLNQQKLALLQGRLSPLAFTNSLACTSLEDVAGVPTARCAAPRAAAPNARTALESRVLNELREKVSRWSASDLKLGWRHKVFAGGDVLNRLNTRLSETEHSIVYGIPLLKCWNRPENWLDEHRRLVRYRSEATIEIQIPVWPIRLGVNASAQPDFQFTGRRPLFNATLTFNPRSIKETGKSAAQLIFKDEILGELTLQNEEIDTCR